MNNDIDCAWAAQAHQRMEKRAIHRFKIILKTKANAERYAKLSGLDSKQMRICQGILSIIQLSGLLAYCTASSDLL